jgi:hypothetical protein
MGIPEDSRLFYIFEEIRAELICAESHGSTFHSLHEAFAVIAEEVDELWDITRMKRKNRDPEEIHKDLIQIAAMAIKGLQSMSAFFDPIMTPSTQGKKVLSLEDGPPWEGKAEDYA